MQLSPKEHTISKLNSELSYIELSKNLLIPKILNQNFEDTGSNRFFNTSETIDMLLKCLDDLMSLEINKTYLKSLL